ncbi:MAG: lysine--tRNA ligase [Acidobacteriota bacterium]|nr:lysine--tRNA ligase [Acidobacteriota bacterium]MDQ5837487.1 lysine--tRNA ligase [Acidobacteriota bacterium]
MGTPLIGNVVEDNDQTRARLSHLEEIKALVGNAYPNKFRRTNLAGSAEGEDTITSIADRETIKRIVGDEKFTEAFDSLVSKAKAGSRPTPEELEPVNAKLNDITVRVSGRLATPPRVMGKAAFVHLSDGKERLQIYVRKQEAKAVSNDTLREVEEVESGWKLFGLLDHGDFVGVEGFLFVTKTGELSVHVRELQFLSKALLPMPDKLHGISDPEIRQRRRYADLIASSLKVRTEEEEKQEGKEDEPGASRQPELSTREVFERRARLIREMRRHLDEHGYIEVETPMLSPIASGAAARPFETFHKALGIPLYLRIAPELYLKRLLVGGFERVYELNRNFRNEGISTRHNPEFTMLEFYTAYKDVNWMMDFCEEMLVRTIDNVIGKRQVAYEGNNLFTEIDFSPRWKRLTMKEAIATFWPAWWSVWSILGGDAFDIAWLDNPKLLRNLYLFSIHPEGYIYRTYGFNIGSSETEAGTRARWNAETAKLWEVVTKSEPNSENGNADVTNHVQGLFEGVAEPNLIQPTFIYDFPKDISPLSKASPDNPAIAERFELYVAGMEVANGFSELNDPAEQLERFEDQTQQRERGDEEAMQMDLDYVRALSYGMPPAAGIGIGVDRLTMLLTNRRSIRDVILFPHMRPQKATEEQSPVTEEAEGASSEA